jgi:hypothetical protein
MEPIGSRKVHVSMTPHSANHAVAISDCITTHLITLERLMNKLMTSLFAATIVGAFSMSAIAADATAAPAAAKKHVAKKHVIKKHHVAKAAAAPAMPAEPAK